MYLVVHEIKKHTQIQAKTWSLLRLQQWAIRSRIHKDDLLQRGGGRQWMVVELGALWLWVKALWWLLGAPGTAICSVCSPAGSGSCTEHVFVVGLETGVPWAGGDEHGEPRGDMRAGGKPERDCSKVLKVITKAELCVQKCVKTHIPALPSGLL